jgi:hypothetical protein
MLYDLCHKHPSQSDAAAVVSKFWLIGRAYAASAERWRLSEANHLKPGENFYDNRLAPVYIQAGLDNAMAPLYGFRDVDECNLMHILEVHSRVSQTLQITNGKLNPSLASKYLHFHLPLLFFIYDSQANANLKKYIAKWKHKSPVQPNYDTDYFKFCYGALALREAIKSEYHIELTPRELDNLLLAPSGQDAAEQRL